MLESATRVPNNFQSAYQKWLVDRGSRSFNTTSGMPKTLTTCSKNKAATVGADSAPSPTIYGTNLTNFDNLSTQVKIVLEPLHKGRSVMKSMVHVSKRPTGVSRGCNNPAGAWVESF